MAPVPGTNSGWRDAQITRVLDALRKTGAHENTIVILTSDHGDMHGAHGAMHEKWHVAYEEALHVPFIVSSPLLPGGARELTIPTTHADLIPTLLGLTGIDAGQALARLQSDHNDARALVGRDLSQAIRAAEAAAPTEPILFTTDDEISEGNERSASPFHRFAARLDRLSTVKQPNHIQTVIAEVEIGGERHLVKFSRYYDNEQFWTLPAERDERLRGRHTETVTEPSATSSSSTTFRSTRSRSATSRTQARRRSLSRPAADDARAAGRAAGREATDAVRRRGRRLPPADALRDLRLTERTSAPSRAYVQATAEPIAPPAP